MQTHFYHVDFVHIVNLVEMDLTVKNMVLNITALAVSAKLFVMILTFLSNLNKNRYKTIKDYKL